MLGDGHLELGHYERAFDAFDMMARLRPDAASYARTGYAHELQGRLGEALRHMRMAAEATGTHDPESLAWHYSQVGNILFRMGRIDAASHEFARAQHAFPGHPYARTGLARVAAARGDYPRALGLYRALLEEAPTPELAASVGDLLARTGDAAGAEAMYARAETLEREGWKSEGATARRAGPHACGTGTRCRPGRHACRGGCAEPVRHLHDGCAGVGVFPGGTVLRGTCGVGAGAPHRHG